MGRDNFCSEVFPPLKGVPVGRGMFHLSHFERSGFFSLLDKFIRLNMEETFRVELGKIDEYELSKISKYITVAKCPKCGNMTSITHEKENAIITPICHEEFAQSLTKSITIYNMNKIACQIRGTVINSFTFLELFMDGVIKKLQFPSVKDYDDYISSLPRGKINMDTKVDFLKNCLEKYKNNYNSDFNIVLENLTTVIDKRNALSHWVVDISNEAIEYFNKQGKIKFVYTDNKGGEYKEVFSYDQANKLSENVTNLLAETGIIFKTIM